MREVSAQDGLPARPDPPDAESTRTSHARPFHNRYVYRIFTIDNRLAFRQSLCIANDCGKRLWRVAR
jgi:hypothetical protein